MDTLVGNLTSKVITPKVYKNTAENIRKRSKTPKTGWLFCRRITAQTSTSLTNA